jgi:hemoglobin-like flavoprotein
MEVEKLKPLTGSQIQLLKKTFRILDTDNLTKRFYTTLFLKHPEVKALFPTNLSELATKLVSVFELVIFSFEEQSPDQYLLHKNVLVPLRNLGKKHVDTGVENKYYPLANEILVQSMKDEVGYLFSDEAEEAWRLAFRHLTTAMLNKELDNVAPESGSMRETFRYIKSFFNS